MGLKRLFLGCSLLLASSALVVFSSARAQDLPDEVNKLRLAQGLEQSAQYEKAARLYEELYARNPQNPVYFDGLYRMYIQLKDYERAIFLVQRRLDRQPGDLNLLGRLGEAYFKSGREMEAYAAWERALATDEKNQNVYYHLYQVLMQNRLFAKGVEVLLRGRRKIGNANLFAADLGYAYTILGSYREATTEYLRVLKENPQLLSFVQTQLALYTGKPEGLEAAIGYVKDEVKIDPKNIVLQRLLAWLHLEGKQFENAYLVYRAIDELSKAGGQELLMFANQAFKEKALEVSARAYRDIIERYPKSPSQPVARFNYARVIEELTVRRDTLIHFDGKHGSHKITQMPERYPAREPHLMYGEAVEHYNEIVRMHPQSEYALQALYRIALIQFDRFFDIEGALRSLSQIEVQFPGHRLMGTVGLKAGEILLAKGDLKKSAERFSQVRQNPLAAPEERDRAFFALAELDYFQGFQDSALSKLDSLVRNLNADIANDALSLQQFIKEHRAREESLLKEYAYAELLERQRKFSEAVSILQKLISVSPTARIADDALLKMGQLQTKMGDPQGGLSTYRKLIAEYPESILRDKAQFSIGEIYQFVLRDKAKAILAYHELLEKHPNSLFLDEARKRVRQLRGDSL